jgi:NTP pyrophosphatase (non-canonical NTP hydrolase)
MSGDYSIGSTHWPGLSKLVEEMGELQQVLGKILGTGGSLHHWDGELGPRVTEEIGDVLAAIAFFIWANDLDLEGIKARSELKKENFKRWHADGDLAPIQK